VPVPNTDLSARWNGIPLWQQGQGPMSRGGKHARMDYDTKRKRLLLTGGDRDGSDAGNSSVWAFTVDGPATLLSPMCRPYPDWLPSFPDNVTWVYDTLRDRAIIMPGYFNDFARMQTMCKRTDDRILFSTSAAGVKQKDGGVFNLTTNAWEPRTWAFPTQGYGGDQGSNFGIYDPQGDMVLRLFWGGGNNLQRIHLATGASSFLPVKHPTDKRVRQTGAAARQHALDVAKRNIYAVAHSNVGGAREWALLRANVDTGAGERLSLPPSLVTPNVGDGGGTDTLLTFDPKKRALIHVAIPSLCGDVSSVWAIYVDEGHRWAQIPLPTSGPPLKGNVLGFDPDKGVAVLLGGHGCGLANGMRTPAPTHYWTLALVKG
jgi:hypothetical protein